MNAPTHPHWRGSTAVQAAARNAPALREGAAGAGVALLRQALQLVGAPSLTEAADRFGPETRAQVGAFQRLYSLGIDGVAGSGTIGKLDLLLATPTLRKRWPTEVAGDREGFLQRVNTACASTVRAAGLPVSAMLACAAVESGWGMGPIFRETGNLFSLQKWPWVVYPRTEGTLWRDTVIQTSPRKTAKAPFNTAKDLQDAARQWCEWIQYYGAMLGPPGSMDRNRPQRADMPGSVARRQRLLGLRGEPLQFARHLHLVGFGESAAHAELYATVHRQNDLARFD